MSSVDDNILLSKSLSLSSSSHPLRESKDSSDDESSPQSKATNNPTSSSPFDISVDYWTILDNSKEKKDGTRTIKSSLKSNIRMLTITRQARINLDGKIFSPLTMTYVTREKKQKSKSNLNHVIMPQISMRFIIAFAFHDELRFLR